MERGFALCVTDPSALCVTDPSPYALEDCDPITCDTQCHRHDLSHVDAHKDKDSYQDEVSLQEREGRAVTMKMEWDLGG